MIIPLKTDAVTVSFSFLKHISQRGTDVAIDVWQGDTKAIDGAADPRGAGQLQRSSGFLRSPLRRVEEMSLRSLARG